MSPASPAPKRKLAQRKRQTALATAEDSNPQDLTWFEEYVLKPADDFFA